MLHVAWSVSVCLCVGHTVELRKNEWTRNDWDAITFGVLTNVHSRNLSCIRGIQEHFWEGYLLACCNVPPYDYRHLTATCAARVSHAQHMRWTSAFATVTGDNTNCCTYRGHWRCSPAPNNFGNLFCVVVFVCSLVYTGLVSVHVLEIDLYICSCVVDRAAWVTISCTA